MLKTNLMNKEIQGTITQIDTVLEKNESKLSSPGMKSRRGEGSPTKFSPSKLSEITQSPHKFPQKVLMMSPSKRLLREGGGLQEQQSMD